MKFSLSEASGACVLPLLALSTLDCVASVSL
jgi:hypothetical protein